MSDTLSHCILTLLKSLQKLFCFHRGSPVAYVRLSLLNDTFENSNLYALRKIFRTSGGSVSQDVFLITINRNDIAALLCVSLQVRYSYASVLVSVRFVNTVVLTQCESLHYPGSGSV